MKYTNYKKWKLPVVLEYLSIYILMAVIYCYLKSENYKVLKFHMNYSSYFEIGV